MSRWCWICGASRGSVSSSRWCRCRLDSSRSRRSNGLLFVGRIVSVSTSTVVRLALSRSFSNAFARAASASSRGGSDLVCHCSAIKTFVEERFDQAQCIRVGKRKKKNRGTVWRRKNHKKQNASANFSCSSRRAYSRFRFPNSSILHLSMGLEAVFDERLTSTLWVERGRAHLIRVDSSPLRTHTHTHNGSLTSKSRVLYRTSYSCHTC